MSKNDLVNLLAPYGQEHIVHFWDDLNDSERSHLQAEIQQTDFAELNSYFERVQSEMDQTVKEIDSLMNPVPDDLKGSFLRSTREELKEYELAGLKAIANGEVAVLLLAGGQGTRLGVKYPKGMYSVNLKSNKTLYQIQAERLVKLKQYALKNFPLPSETK